MVYITTAPTSAVSTAPAPVSEVSIQARPSLQTRLEAALEHARRLTAMYGSNTMEVAIAWETVDELRKADREQRQPHLSAFARYCAANPEAPEARIYCD